MLSWLPRLVNVSGRGFQKGRDVYTLKEGREGEECCMQNKCLMERLGGKQGRYGIFEELKSNGAWFRVEEK